MNEEEVGRVRAAVARAVRAICPSWLASEVDDLAQAATLKILEKCARDAGSELNATYLWRTAHSVVIDCLRIRRRRPTQQLEPESGEIRVASANPGPEARLEGSRLRNAIRACLAAMVGPRRRAVTLRLFGHSLAEVARICAWPAKRADNLVYRGLADLRECLRAKGYGDES